MTQLMSRMEYPRPAKAKSDPLSRAGWKTRQCIRQRSLPLTFKEWTHPGKDDGRFEARVLAESKFHEVGRNVSQRSLGPVRDEKRAYETEMGGNIVPNRRKRKMRHAKELEQPGGVIASQFFLSRAPV